MAVADKDKVVTLECLKAYDNFGHIHLAASSFANLETKVAAISGDAMYQALISNSSGSDADAPASSTRWVVWGFKNSQNNYCFQKAMNWIEGRIYTRRKSNSSTWSSWQTFFGGTDAAAVRSAIGAVTQVTATATSLLNSQPVYFYKVGNVATVLVPGHDANVVGTIAAWGNAVICTVPSGFELATTNNVPVRSVVPLQEHPTSHPSVFLLIGTDNKLVYNNQGAAVTMSNNIMATSYTYICK